MGSNAKRRVTREVAEFYPSQGQWTEEDYFALPDTNRHTELSEGRLVVPPHPTDRHQRALLNLVIHLRAFVDSHDLGVVQIAPLPVRLWLGKIREPDILFVAREHGDRIGEQVYGVPDLAVEVVSPGTRRTDRVEKFVEYARAGVREYWIVDPEESSIEVYTSQEGAYSLLGKFRSGEVARSQLLSGLEIPVDEVFSSPRS